MLKWQKGPVKGQTSAPVSEGFYTVFIDRIPRMISESGIALWKGPPCSNRDLAHSLCEAHATGFRSGASSIEPIMENLAYTIAALVEASGGEVSVPSSVIEEIRGALVSKHQAADGLSIVYRVEPRDG